jgi:hypothetical protein
VGFFPSGGCDARDPEDDEEVTEGLFEGCGHEFKDFIGDAIGTRGLVVS